MIKGIKESLLGFLFLAAAGIPYNLPPEMKDPYEHALGSWLLYLGIAWGIAVLVLIVACKFGPELTYDQSAQLSEIIHRKHFPKNLREMLFVAIFFSGIGLMILVVAYGSAYGVGAPS